LVSSHSDLVHSTPEHPVLPRTLEPEVMDTPEEARDYDAMDHAAVNRLFVDDLLAALPPFDAASRPPRVLDVGTGTALIPIELARRGLPIHTTAVDLAEQMLALARRNVEAAGFEEVIALRLVDAKSLPFEDDAFDAVISNSIVHHVPEPRGALAEMLRVLRPEGLLLVRDLLRPADEATVEHLVRTYAGDETAEQRQLFRQSLHAALTVEEIRDRLADLGLPRDACQRTTDRHWTITARKSP
jgi:ubiquinone/menaquinone biosynthesis C-methylase UbiE